MCGRVAESGSRMKDATSGGGLKTRQQFAAFVQKLLPPAEVIFQHLVKLRLGGDLHDFFVEFVAWAEPLGIPRRDFAEHPAAEFLAKHFNHQIQMPAHHPHALGESWLPGGSSPV